MIEEVFNKGRLELADEIVAPNAIDHDPALPEPVVGPEGSKQLVAGYRAAFPDVRITIDDQIAEGDRVVTRWTARGTHKGDLWGISPTGNEATVTGITIDRIEGGQIVESWTNWDTLGLMQQIGVIPTMATA
jgi:steroid delta-isomerase-like uncharacterized protein